MIPKIEVKNVCKRFGGVQALQDVEIHAEPGEVVGLIGPNGAGKSTLVNCITGMIKIDSGSIQFKKENITRIPPYHRARRGIGRTFQKVRLAINMTVYENVLTGLFPIWFHQPALSSLLQFLAPVNRSETEKRVRQALELTGIEFLQDEKVETLPYGQRHFVELARALVSEPELLLLDEPATGLTELERDRLVSIVEQFCSTGRSVILIEHDLALVGRMCNRVAVLDYGKLIFTGTPAEAQQDSNVVSAYLGTKRLEQNGGITGG